MFEEEVVVLSEDDVDVSLVEEDEVSELVVSVDDSEFCFAN